MFGLLKIFFYLVIAIIIIGLYWFLPKYSYIQKNPGYCVKVSGNFYYCGNNAGLGNLFK